MNEIIAEFTGIETGGFETKKLVEYLPKLNQRVYGMKQDLETFLRIIEELNVNVEELADVKKHQLEAIRTIKVKMIFFIHFLLTLFVYSFYF